MAHEARVAIAWRDHHAPGQHGGEHDRATGARAEQLGVAHDVRMASVFHGERHGAGVHQQRADNQNERERRVALHHVFLAHPDQYEGGYAQSAYSTDRRHRQCGRYPHVLLPRDPYRAGRDLGRNRRGRRRHRWQLARWTRVRVAFVQVGWHGVQSQCARTVRVLYIGANGLPGATVLGHVHQSHVVFAVAAVQQQQLVQHPFRGFGAVTNGLGYRPITRRRRLLAALNRCVLTVAASATLFFSRFIVVRVHYTQHVGGRLYKLGGDRLFHWGRSDRCKCSVVAHVRRSTVLVAFVNERTASISLKNEWTILKVWKYKSSIFKNFNNLSRYYLCKLNKLYFWGTKNEQLKSHTSIHD